MNIFRLIRRPGWQTFLCNAVKFLHQHIIITSVSGKKELCSTTSSSHSFSLIGSISSVSSRRQLISFWWKLYPFFSSFFCVLMYCWFLVVFSLQQNCYLLDIFFGTYVLKINNTSYKLLQNVCNLSDFIFMQVGLGARAYSTKHVFL